MANAAHIMSLACFMLVLGELGASAPSGLPLRQRAAENAWSCLHWCHRVVWRCSSLSDAL